MVIHKDEVEIEFVSGLGQILGKTIINKEDIKYIAEFAKKSKHTDVMLNGNLLSRI